MGDEVGFDGVTVREAISSRTLGGINKIIQAYSDKKVNFPGAYLGIVALIESNLPFCEPNTKTVLHQVSKIWDGMAKEWAEVGIELDISEGKLASDFGDWATR